MIENEQIHIINYSTGTTVLYFTNKPIFKEYLTNFESYDSYLTFNNLGQPYQLETYDGKNIWIRENPENNFIQLSSVTLNYMTGYTYITVYPEQLDNADKTSILDAFLQNVNQLYSGQNPTSYVFFKDGKVNDFSLNVSLRRSYSFLDTLNIYNRATGFVPKQEANTGVVFGKLVANQNIKDEFGNTIKIPLANVPIGIFNPSDEFSNPSSTDEDGNRIILNLQNNSAPSDYFDDYSYSADTSYLPSDNSSLQVPDKFKYVTFTNENGEFVLHSVPTGNQILLFEVDLFKQGLTSDEIFLNRGFPFPVTDVANIDSIPAYYFKQIPINIVPTWGQVQSGYTEVNLSVNLDLRKWATFFVSPVATSAPQYAGVGEGGVSNLNELNAFDSIPLSVSVRDMSLEGYPVHDIKLVEIVDIFNRKQNAYSEWNNEIPQLKSQAEFRDRFFSVFKVPANLYDPEGYSTDISGFTTNKKGVWIASYQYKMFLDSEDRIFRTTGLYREWLSSGGYITRDNYHVNRNNTDTTQGNYATRETSFGIFPYEQPWTINYPEPYKIPHTPTARNYDFNSYQGRYSLTTNAVSTSQFPSEQPYAVEQPKFLDGDMIGFEFDELSDNLNLGGWSLQLEDNDFVPNSFSQQVTRSFLYKYENQVSWHEEYANGYQPNNPFFQIQPGISSVQNGEKYQRVECGYSYLLKPEGWPILCHLPKSLTLSNSSFDIIYPPSIGENQGLNGDFGPSTLPQLFTPSLTLQNRKSHISDVYDLTKIQTKVNSWFALAMDDSCILKEGSLDLYRLIHPDLFNKKTPSLPTFINLNFQSFKFQRGVDDSSNVWSQAINSGGGNGQAFWTDENNARFIQTINDMRIEIKNEGSRAVRVNYNNAVILPGETTDISPINNMNLILNGNDDFNYTTKKYERAKYSIKLKNIRLYNNDGNQEGPVIEYPVNFINLSANTTDNIPDYYLVTYLRNIRTNRESGGLCTPSYLGDLDGGKLRNIKHDGPSIINTDQPITSISQFDKMVFENQPISDYLVSGVNGCNHPTNIDLIYFVSY